LRDEQKLVLDAATAVRVADTAALAAADDEGLRLPLDQFLSHIEALLLEAAEATDHTHFVHMPPQVSLGGLTDASGDERPWR
jgi:hypothetical protein